MSTFAEEQGARDSIIARALADGRATVPGIPDDCRRWSTCNHCDHRSREMLHLAEQAAWEDDHVIWGCTAIRGEITVIDPDLPWFEFPHPAEWTFTRELLPLDATVHVYRPSSHEYTSGRAPQARTAA